MSIEKEIIEVEKELESLKEELQQIAKDLKAKGISSETRKELIEERKMVHEDIAEAKKQLEFLKQLPADFSVDEANEQPELAPSENPDEIPAEESTEEQHENELH